MFRQLIPIQILILLLSTSASAQVVPVPMDDRIDKAARIAVGRVVDQYAYWVDGQGAVTANRVQVSGWLKGHDNDPEVFVLTLGGVVGNRATIVQPSLRLELGQEYLLLLDAAETKMHDRAVGKGLYQSFAYADMQGALPLQFGFYRDTFADQFEPSKILNRVADRVGEVARTPRGDRYEPSQQKSTRPPAAKQVSSFSPNPTHAGTIDNADFITISGSGFGASPGNVFYSNADDGGATFTASGVASDNVSWSANSIVNKPADNAGTGPIAINGSDVSAGTLTVDWAHNAINSDFASFPGVTRQRYLLRNLNGSGGMTFQYNTAFDANTAAVEAFERALSSWRCESGVNYQPVGTTGVSSAIADGVNVVTFGSLPDGVLGRATSRFSGSAVGGCQQENTVWYAEEVDIVFAPGPFGGRPWNFGPDATTFNEFDFESVAVHELGHGIGLGHIIAPGLVMHYSLSNGTDVRSPSADDIDAAQNKVAYSDDASCFNPAGSGTPMIPVTPMACDLNPGDTDILFADSFE